MGFHRIEELLHVEIITLLSVMINVQTLNRNLIHFLFCSMCAYFQVLVSGGVDSTVCAALMGKVRAASFQMCKPYLPSVLIGLNSADFELFSLPIT